VEEEEKRLLFDERQLKEENFFFMSFDPHLSQDISFSEEPDFCKKEKTLLHFLHIYS